MKKQWCDSHKNSIAKYGYNNPILIDKDNVIISKSQDICLIITKKIFQY